MSESNINSNNIIVEITEETKLKDIANSINKLNELKRQTHCLFALDDYGSGYSSFINLTRLPIRIVKLDRLLVKNLDDEKLAETTTGIISLIKKLDYKIVSEGVETKEQFLKLKKAGCDFYQGFYFAKPTPGILDTLLSNKGCFMPNPES